MKYNLYRKHKVNVDAQYEGVEIAGGLEFDTEVDSGLLAKNQAVEDFLVGELDALLASDVQRALDSGAVEDTHIQDFYKD